MTNNRFPIFLTMGCLGLIILLSVAAVAGFFVLFVSDQSGEAADSDSQSTAAQVELEPLNQNSGGEAQAVVLNELPSLSSLYETVSPGVVNINVVVDRSGLTGSASGSGFVLDDTGHIVTNQHVVAGATIGAWVVYKGDEALAVIIGTDPDCGIVRQYRCRSPMQQE